MHTQIETTMYCFDQLFKEKDVFVPSVILPENEAT